MSAVDYIRTAFRHRTELVPELTTILALGVIFTCHPLNSPALDWLFRRISEECPLRVMGTRQIESLQLFVFMALFTPLNCSQMCAMHYWLHLREQTHGNAECLAPIQQPARYLSRDSQSSRYLALDALRSFSTTCRAITLVNVRLFFAARALCVER